MENAPDFSGDIKPAFRGATTMPSGGNRPGAGKRPGKHGTKAAYSLKLTPDVIEFLRETYPEGAAGHVDATIRKQKAFKDWLAKRELRK